jgi:hypothetical protein
MDRLATREARGEAVGPFIDPAVLLEGFGCPRELLRRMTAARVLLALPGRDGRIGYPAFQFDEGGEPLPGLPLVLESLDPAGSHAWRDAVWLTTPSDCLIGSTPAEALREGRLDDVLALAASDAPARA